MFREGEGGLIVATSMLGLGINILDIRVVIHVGVPRNIIDFGQESGRVGRDGEDSQLVIVVGVDQLSKLQVEKGQKVRQVQVI